MKVVIIGNGFDLHHGMKTRFDDFRDFMMRISNSPSMPSGVESIFTRNGFGDDGLTSFITAVDEMVGTIDDDFSWSDFEEKLFRKVKSLRLNRSNGDLETFHYIDKIHTVFCLTFEYYLKTLELPTYKFKQMNKVLVEADLIIVFNYTTSYSIYLNPEELKKAVHIHGNLNQNQSLVIGYERDSDIINSHNYVDKDNYNYGDIKYFSKHYLTDRQTGIEFFTNLEPILRLKNKVHEISIIGWSFGDSDKYFSQIVDHITPNYPNKLFMSEQEFASSKQTVVNIYSRIENESSILSPYESRLVTLKPVYRVGYGL